MTIGDFRVGMSKNTGKIGSFGSGGVHSRVFGCLGENGQNINLHNFFLCFVKTAVSQEIVCVGAENTIFPIC